METSVALVALVAIACGCRERHEGVAPESPEAERETNRLHNASFEGETSEPWFDFADRNPAQWGAMAIARSHVHDGEQAALLELDSAGSDEPVRVLGAVQEISGPCPAYVSGWYFVERWERGSEQQYLQVVAIAMGGETPPGVPNYQVARTLAGVEAPPFVMKNRRFEIGGPVEPVQGEWVFFEIDLAAMFERQWKRIPGEDASLRLFFEVRYDARGADDARARARVWFDALYAGPESRAASP